jgi:CheY-like chemotaxis protein
MNVTIGFGGPHRLTLSPEALTRAQLPSLAVLVVDDEAEVREELCSSLTHHGLAVLAAGDGATALRILAGRPDVGALLTDLRMPGMDGLELAQAALSGRDTADALEVVLISGYVTPAHGLAAERIGAFGMLAKPMRGARLAAMVQEALESAAQRRRAALGLAPPVDLPPAPPPGPAAAAEALLHTLTQRAIDGESLATLARQIRQPLQALLGRAPAELTEEREIRRVIALVDEVVDLATLERAQRARDLEPVSAQALAAAIAAKLQDLGIRCGRRIILQPDATPAYQLHLARLTRAFAVLATRAQRDEAAPLRADLAIDAGAGTARLELTLRPEGLSARPAEPAVDSLLSCTIARRLAALSGGRLDAWLLPDGGLRARLILGVA